MSKKSVTSARSKRSVVEGKLVPPPGARIHERRIRYNPDGKGEIEADFVLLNYLNENAGSWEEAHKWADSYGLEKIDQRELRAVGEQYPNFPEILNQKAVVATTENHAQFGGDDTADSFYLGDFGPWPISHDLNLAWLIFRKKKS